MNATLSLNLPVDLLQSARMTLDEVRLELAIALFRLDRLSMGRAAELAGLPVADFQGCLSARRVGPHYGVEDALTDAAMLAQLRGKS
jgi:predicted HTH domain antitoxin